VRVANSPTEIQLGRSKVQGRRVTTVLDSLISVNVDTVHLVRHAM
jgi:hypothetical protein